MKGVLLLSDGIDSPVAGHLMLKKMDLIFLSFIQEQKMVPKIRRIIEILKPGSELVTIDHNSFQKKVQKNCNTRYQCILCKRRMYREAERVAREHNAEFIVTGENIGQVASQTLVNLSVLEDAATIPVLRPLLGFDKNETIMIAKKIGTYDISIKDASKCPYVPKNPTTQAVLATIKKEEQQKLLPFSFIL